ncbi:hypothetical protein CDL15_Pgr003815 [Punica granatum]|uniref:Protein kinase domain-containing protein n=1 Tax=Punica granatum TaxID=22663 RepID=A0A218XTX2_PUNGR|nr:hypothetical protein CDL15_Pgr003815 [Punica granatum]
MGLFRCLLFLLLLVAFPCPRTVCGNAELEALMEIKSSLDPGNKILTSWTREGDFCAGSFEGVACNQHHKVANISLQGKGLSGSVSPAVAELKCLSGLYLHYNSLTGEIPKEISNLTELTDLYLNMNNLSGSIPSEIGNMASLQVLQLCCNQLTGNIPQRMGSLKKLSVLALQHNKLTGEIPQSLGNLATLTRLILSFNLFTGTIPLQLANLPQLQVLDVQNNSLTGFVPNGLKRLDRGFQYENNRGLCGFGFASMRVCNDFDRSGITDLPFGVNTDKTVPGPQTAIPLTHSGQSRVPRMALIAGILTAAIVFIVTGTLTFYRFRRGKQKIGSTVDASESRLSTDHSKDVCSRSASPLVSLEYCSGWDPLDDGIYGNGLGLPQQVPQGIRFTLEEVESATHYFSEANLLGRSNFSSVYKGVLRDGSQVAIRSINATSCKSEEADFVNGLNLLTSLRHENLIQLRGFCCSKGRGECFLVYDFASKGNLSQYLELEDGSSQSLDWPTRISITKGIAKGIGYLHSGEANRPPVVHQNISAEKILLDQQLSPLIMDSGLPKLLADDVIFSTLKTSAAMGCLAPEYITTGRFTEKSDVYAFGVIVFQILSGKLRLTSSMRFAAESCNFGDFIDPNLLGNFTKPEAEKLTRIALGCMAEVPESRPSILQVTEELENCGLRD